MMVSLPRNLPCAFGNCAPLSPGHASELSVPLATVEIRRHCRWETGGPTPGRYGHLQIADRCPCALLIKASCFRSRSPNARSARLSALLPLCLCLDGTIICHHPQHIPPILFRSFTQCGGAWIQRPCNASRRRPTMRRLHGATCVPTKRTASCNALLFPSAIRTLEIWYVHTSPGICNNIAILCQEVRAHQQAIQCGTCNACSAVLQSAARKPGLSPATSANSLLPACVWL